MKHLVATSCILLASCFSLPETKVLPPQASAVASALQNTVALVTPNLQVFCAGVVTNGVVVTAAHCIEEDTSVLVAERLSGEQFDTPNSFEVLYNDPRQDIAVLRPSTFILRDGRPLAPEAPRFGDKTIVVGHPMGLVWTVSTGIVSHPRRVTPSGMVWMQTDSDIIYGNSGGPVFNVYGEVVGIVSFMAYSERHLAGAVHWETVREVVDEVSQ